MAVFYFFNMAITFMGFNLPETVKSMANGEINHF